MASPPPVAEDQTRLLEEALGVVRQQSGMMRKCLETPGKLMDALKCGYATMFPRGLSRRRFFRPAALCFMVANKHLNYRSTLVSELRTPSLGPKQYYELYMAVFDALRHLSVYLKENHPVNHLADLYELVQYAGNIVPRLYLMITVGTVYMSVEDAPVKEIMKDMMEMSRGVQHPIRGLFLRYYLSGQARDYLPSGTGDGPDGNMQDSISFVLTNFVEMNKLWVRLQHQGPSRERERRMQERRELELLVGSNVVRLSQLVDLETYKSGILQALLEQIVQCRDVLAQEYLLEVITKVFPDEFHLNTLDMLLSAISRLNPQVDLKKIVIGLMDRLSTYAAKENESTAEPESRKQSEEEAVTKLLEKLELDKEKKKKEAEEAAREPQENGAEEPNKTEAEDSGEQSKEKEETAPTDDDKNNLPAQVKLYDVFYEQVVNLIKTRALPIHDTMALLVSLVNLALNIYPDHLEYVDQVLDFATQKTMEYADHADLHSAPTQQHILHLLSAPLRSYISIFTALTLPHYLPLLSSQSYPTRRSVAGEIVRSLLKNKIYITSSENLERVLQVARVLIKEGIQQSTGYPGGQAQRRGGETDETIEEQGWLARLVHLIQAPDNDTQLKVKRLHSTQWANFQLTIQNSFFKQLAKPMLTEMNASDTLHQLSSQRQSASLGNSSRESTMRTTGKHNRQPSTVSFISVSTVSTNA